MHVVRHRQDAEDAENSVLIVRESSRILSGPITIEIDRSEHQGQAPKSEGKDSVSKSLLDETQAAPEEQETQRFL